MQFAQFEAHAAMEECHWWFLGRRIILEALLRALIPPSKQKLIVDVGSGTGGVTKYLSGTYRVIGVEPTQEGCDFARKRFPDCTFVHGYAPHDVSEFGSADAVLLIEVLEHVEKDVELVHSLIAGMKPGAYLIMIAPADMSLWGPHDDAFEHFRRYDSLEEFRNLWRGTSVREVLACHCMRRLYPVVKMMRWLSALRGKSWGKGGTDIDVPMAPVNAFLKKFYGGEARTLLKAVHEKGKGYAKGVSVIAVLQKS